MCAGTHGGMLQRTSAENREIRPDSINAAQSGRSAGRATASGPLLELYFAADLDHLLRGQGESVYGFRGVAVKEGEQRETPPFGAGAAAPADDHVTGSDESDVVEINIATQTLGFPQRAPQVRYLEESEVGFEVPEPLPQHIYHVTGGPRHAGHVFEAA
jgi:hypothetical protein